ncbi:calpain-1 catalytic subunit-like isoform X2 [Triplophysa rosa]|uniref:calpain-1 catalytic subunit-like isoform X2 n=1 Tax=Triplophysa rosa TaxID=992332 RepID=UPI002545BEA9|nr:calpain-1 catalytic subunit-like isoform X2 [Triplophysa rosa]XP_057183884.1 calpain-1 catalytic subunit-like isoform X2 [Triplophysa rosa]
MPPPDVNKTHEDAVGSLKNPLKFLDQDYQTLHQSLLSKKMQFSDESFPANRSSIGTGLLSDKVMAQVKWKRPSEIVLYRPCLVVDGVSRFDYAQGSKLGDCWFLASIGAVSSQMDIMDQVIPAEQSFSKGYAGIFHFMFWRFGKWIDVVIDDQLPTINNRLIFVSSKIATEFWPALLEKAYAKVCGSFADLHGGFVSEALIDFTGGVHMHFDIKEAPANLWNMMESAFKSKTLMGCSTPRGVTTKEPVRLVRMFNPWGKGEWTGDWSDRSPLWKTVSANDNKNCLSVADNGEFWMSMEDYTKSFKTMDICCLSPDFLNGSSKCSWSSQYHIGQWTTETAGGIRAIWKNPQFRVRIEKPGEDCAGGECPENILVSLMQNHENRRRKQLPHLFIGFFVYEIPPEIKDEGGKYSISFFSRRKPVARTDFANLREVMKFFNLEPGEYLIVPSTLSPAEMASFVLSVFTKHQCKKC